MPRALGAEETGPAQAWVPEPALVPEGVASLLGAASWVLGACRSVSSSGMSLPEHRRARCPQGCLRGAGREGGLQQAWGTAGVSARGARQVGN